MKISSISLTNFRNVKNLDLEINQDFVIFAGPNACGKTTLLESIFYASVLTAFPPGKSWELIRLGEEFFRLKLAAGSNSLEYFYGKKQEKSFVRSQSVNTVRKKAGEMIGVLPTVSFLPQDLNLLQLSPGHRRDYLDEILLQAEPDYAGWMTEYSKVLAQRNQLLLAINSRQAKTSELDFWDSKLVELAEQIQAVRRKLAEFFDHNLKKKYLRLTAQPLDLNFQYSPSGGGTAIKLTQSLQNNRGQDIASGRTAAGPHRDDWRVIDSGGRDLAHFLSRGEQRSVILSAKLQELEYLKSHLGRVPIILLDELLAELDTSRQKEILENLPLETQKFLTTTDAEEIPKGLKSVAQVIELGKGKD